MNPRVFNFCLAIFWFAICIGLLTRDWWMPAGMHEKVTGPQTPLVIALTAVLTVWNLLRFAVSKWFASPPKESDEVAGYRRRIRAMSGEDPKVTDPQFNFNDPPANDRAHDGSR
jgi:hypothetical protein